MPPGPPPDGAAWGSDDAGVQNVNVISPPTNGWSVAVILLDSDDAQLASTATLSSDWVDWFQNDADSVNAQFNEVSYGAFSVSAEAFGPFAMGGN